LRAFVAFKVLRTLWFICRSIIYRANLARFREVALFLLKDCCGGRPDICAPIVANLTPCCPAKVGSHD
jgi:ArsR family transcriptional regulator, arsenate/arsenite/antimonite-responsive transcriptional repressor